MAKAKSTEKETSSYSKWLLGEEEETRERLTQNQWAAPHVFVGIGGTGTQTVARIAERLAKLVSQSKGTGGVLPGCLQFVAMDTDSSELSPEIRMLGVEVVDLTVSDPDGVWAENEKAFRELGFDKPLQIELGAGGKRKFGRFAFAAHAETVKRALSSAFAEAQRYPGLVDNRLRIHVFFSLAGGTGCGAFLDLAFLIREMTARRAEVYGYLVMPDNIVATVSPYTLASAGGALKELEYFMQLGRGKFEGWGSAPRARQRIQYWKGGRVKGHIRRPFDICYVFGSRGKGQGSVAQPASFKGVLAEAALRCAFSEAGQQNRRRAQGGDLDTYFEENDWLGKYPSFSAIGFSRLMLPTRDLGAYLTLSLAEAACDYLLNGQQRWDRQTKDVKALLQTYAQRLTVGFSVDQVVPKNRRGVLDVGAAISELEKLHTRKKDADIKRACDGLTGLYDQLRSDSEKTRAEAIKSKVAILREQFEKHMVDLHVGMADDLAFFRDLRAQLRENQAAVSENAEKKREAMERYLAKIPLVTKYLGKKGIVPWLTHDTNFNQLKGAYQLAVSGIRDHVLARANLQSASDLIQHMDTMIGMLTQTVETLTNDLKARFATRRKYFHSRLKNMRFGRGGDDCKTFCPVEVNEITEQAEKMLDPLRSRFGPETRKRLRKHDSISSQFCCQRSPLTNSGKRLPRTRRSGSASWATVGGLCSKQAAPCCSSRQLPKPESLGVMPTSPKKIWIVLAPPLPISATTK